jgi:hypothetical protein
MKLELVPIEGKKVLTEEEKERLKQRSRPIPPAVICRFSETEQAEIILFLTRLVVFTEQFHHNMEQHDLHQHDDSFEDQLVRYEEHMERLNADRNLLFQNPAPAIAKFIQLLDLCPMESWQEFEALIKSLQVEELHRYRDARLKIGIQAAMDNPFLMQAEEPVEEERIEQKMKCRITPAEIEELFRRFSLVDIVRYMIDSRRLSTGEFWDDGYYDL